MNVYVAAPLSLWAEARRTMEVLRGLGHVITHDWTKGAEAYFVGDRSEKGVDIATACIDAVVAASLVFVILSTTVPTQGLWCEIGAALALRRPVIVYLPDLPPFGQVEAFLERAAFLHHPLCRVIGGYNRAIGAIMSTPTKQGEKQ